MSWYLTPKGGTYEASAKNFSWEEIPSAYNIAVDCLRKHDSPDETVALYYEADGQQLTYTFGDLDRISNRLANAFVDKGVERGDRVAIAMGQNYATLASHMACWKIGAISVPLSIQFGARSLRYRLSHSGATLALADTSIRDTVSDVRSACPDLADVVWVDTAGLPVDDHAPFGGLIAGISDRFDPVDTDVDTPAIIIYTSGTTGTPKGVVHTHGVWLGHCPAFYMYFERDLIESVYWTPADWAWIGALGSLVFPAWHYGQPVVGTDRERFSPERELETLERFDVTRAFVPPTALRMIKTAAVSPDEYDLHLETIVSGSESLTPDIVSWVETVFDDVLINEGYGQTEASVLATNCQDWFELRPGSMGKPVIGFDVAVIDPESGEEKPRGEVGEIAVKRTAPVGLFTEYWNEPDRTESVRLDEWHLTGDLAVQDEDDYLWFQGRTDDLIITSGYRVAPSEIERTLIEHPSVNAVAVVGVPDETRGEIIKAIVEPQSRIESNRDLRAELETLVREEVAEYAYPREISFVSRLPRTDTGKIDRGSLDDL